MRVFKIHQLEEQRSKLHQAIALLEDIDNDILVYAGDSENVGTVIDTLLIVDDNIALDIKRLHKKELKAIQDGH